MVQTRLRYDRPGARGSLAAPFRARWQDVAD